MIEFPWWVGILVLAYLFVAYFSVGAVLGFALTFAGLGPRSKTERVRLSCVGALVGAYVNFLVTWLSASGL